MAFEADRVVVELLAQNDQFDAATKSSAANFQQSMAGIKTAGAQAEGAVGQFSSALKSNRLEMNQSRIGMMEFQHIARGVSDQYAASGLSAQLLTSHIGELSEAVVLSGGAFGKLGLFLQGPWGIALTLATTLVGTLVASHLKGANAAEKHKSAEEILTEYINGEAVATDALANSIKKLNDERAKGLESTNEQLRAEQELAASVIHTAEAHRTSLLVQLASARAEAAAAQASATGAAGGPAYASAAAAGAAAVKQANVAALQRDLDNVTESIGQATALISTDLTTLARNLSTHVGRANDEFDKQLAALEAKYRGTETRRGNQTVLAGGLFNQPGSDRTRLEQQLIAAEEKLSATRAKAVDAARKLDEAEQGKTADASRQFGKQIGFAEAEAIARGAGLNVTSAYRSEAKQAELYRTVRTAENPVAKPGTSAHEGINGKWALDIAFAPGLTPASIRKLYGAQGVSLSAIYKESGHYHIEGSRSEAAAAETAEQRARDKAAREAAAAAQKEAEQSKAYQSEMDRLNGEYIAARKDQVKDALTQLDFSEQEVVAQQQKRDDSYRGAAKTKQITDKQAEALIAVSATVAAEKLKALETQKQVVLIQRADDAAERTAQYHEDNLRAAEQDATSQAQRRELDLAILDILYDEKLAHLERLKLLAEANHDLQAANDLQSQIDQLPTQKANDRNGVLRQTMDPLEQWLHSVPHDADAVTEALQGIAVNGFDQIASSIAGVVTGTETLGRAFGNVAKQIVGDLIQMTIKMLIFRALSSVIGGGTGSLGGLSISPDITSPLASPALSGGAPASSLIQLAGGGSGVIGGMGGVDNNLLSLNGSPIAWVSQGEGLTITPSNAAAASPFAASGRAVVIVGVQANDYFDAQVLHVTGPVIAQASGRSVTGGAALAQHTLARAALHRLG